MNYNNGEVFVYAIRNCQPETFVLLLAQGISYKAIFTVVMEALRASQANRVIIFTQLLNRFGLDHINTALKYLVLEEDSDLCLIEILLTAGAEVEHENGVCIKHAAYNLNLDLVRLLSQSLGYNQIIFTQALSSIVNRGTHWISFEHVELISVLLRHGASGQIVNKALVQLVDHVAGQDALTDLRNTFLGLLLSVGADVNFENGKAVGIAAGKADVFLLTYFLRQGASSATASMALSMAILAHHPEPLLLQLIDVFADQRTALADFNQGVPGMLPPFLLCLKSYPHSTVLLDRLVKAGAELNCKVPWLQYPDESLREWTIQPETQEPEPVSVLMWALLQREVKISLAVFSALVGYGGKC